MAKLGKGFEQFDNLGECLEFVQSLAGQYPGKGKAYYDVTGTPIESLVGSHETNYQDGKYDFTGWGPDRNTPWGPLPEFIVAIRSDLAKLIKGSQVKETPSVSRPVLKPLMRPDWKPAPGFELPW